MDTKLKKYFPMLWEKKELLWKIRNSPNLSAIFDGWKSEEQKEFLDFCTGVRGLKFLYDGFFKEIMNPEYTPERLDDFLSLLLKRKVKVRAILPNDSTRIADESSLLITDIVVELEDGCLANVEVQKIGYYFPGQRSACYSSDLLLRQYKRIRGILGKKFSYKDIQDVYTIILFEESPSVFQKFPNTYVHYFSQCSDTGLKLELLQKFLFIPLDIFLKNQHNKGDTIENRLDAWLLFFASDEPDDILKLIKRYPQFQAMYEQAYQLCRNVEDVMGLFSEELRMLDRNTVQLMIDDMQKTIDTQKEQLSQIDEELSQKKEQLSQKNEQLSQKDEQLSQKDEQLSQKNEQLLQTNHELEHTKHELSEKERLLGEKEILLKEALLRIKELEKS